MRRYNNKTIEAIIIFELKIL